MTLPRTIATVVLYASLYAACQIPKPKHIEPDDPCGASCARAAVLQCVEHTGAAGPDDVYGTADDVPCETACADLLAADPTVEPLLQCTANAHTCAAVDACAESVL